MSEKEFRTEYQGTFTDGNKALRELVKNYVDETESYDVTVCTGGQRYGYVLPANGYEMGLISRNAKHVYRRYLKQAIKLGYTEKSFRREMILLESNERNKL